MACRDCDHYRKGACTGGKVVCWVCGEMALHCHTTETGVCDVCKDALDRAWCNGTEREVTCD